MSIKLLDPNATFKIVSLYDDAVDMEKSNVQDYARTVDLSHLKFKEGKTPSYFLVKNITPEDGIEIQDAHFKFLPGGKGPDGKDLPPKVEVVDRAKMAYKYFKAAVRQIEHEGKTIDVQPGNFKSEIVVEVGSYVITLSQLGDAEKKSSTPS